MNGYNWGMTMTYPLFKLSQYLRGWINDFGIANGYPIMHYFHFIENNDDNDCRQINSLFKNLLGANSANKPMKKNEPVNKTACNFGPNSEVATPFTEIVDVGSSSNVLVLNRSNPPTKTNIAPMKRNALRNLFICFSCDIFIYVFN